MASSQACLLSLTMGRVSMAFSQVLVDSFSSSHLHAWQDTLQGCVSTAHLQAKLERFESERCLAAALLQLQDNIMHHDSDCTQSWFRCNPHLSGPGALFAIFLAYPSMTAASVALLESPSVVRGARQAWQMTWRTTSIASLYSERLTWMASAENEVLGKPLRVQNVVLTQHRQLCCSQAVVFQV